MQDMEEIINIVVEKNKGDEKEFITYLREQDLSTLNKILLYFTPSTLTPLQLYKPILGSIGVCISLICIHFILVMYVYLEQALSEILTFYIYGIIFIAILSINSIFQGIFPSKKKRIKAIYKVTDTQKIISMAMFVLKEKYAVVK